MNDKTVTAPLHDNLRDLIGQAISDEIAAGAAQPDWCDSREIDRLADAVLAVLPKRRTTLSPELRAALEDAAKTGTTVAEMPGGGLVFINRGEQPEDGADLNCPACGGSGHADDARASAAPLETVDTPQFRQTLDYLLAMGWRVDDESAQSNIRALVRDINTWQRDVTAKAVAAALATPQEHAQAAQPCTTPVACGAQGCLNPLSRCEEAAPDNPITGEIPPLPEPLEIDWPNLNRNALGCGVEDRGIHDRYAAAEYGWEDGVERAIERVPEQIFDAEQMHAYARAAILAARQSAPVAAAMAQGDIVPPAWISEVCGPEVDDLSYGQGFRNGFNQCRDVVLESLAARPPADAAPVGAKPYASLIESPTARMYKIGLLDDENRRIQEQIDKIERDAASAQAGMQAGEPSAREQKLAGRVSWNTKQWYEHVGAWENGQDQIVFGSVMALRAMMVQFQAVALYAADRRAASQDSERDAALPAAVIAWQAAEKARIEAVGKYNGKLAAAKEHGFPGPDMGAEFKVMTDASNAAHHLQRAMYEAIAAMAAQQAPEGGAG